MKIEMNNNNEAMKAMEIIESVINANKELYNDGYRRDASALLLEAIEVNNNCVVIPDEDFGCFLPEETDAFKDILEAIAKQLKVSFEAKIFSTCDCTEEWIEAVCDGKELTIKTTYFPSGFSSNFFCYECGEEIALLYEEVEVAPNKYEIHISEEVASGTYTCPHCGETIDITDELPIITTTTMNI